MLQKVLESSADKSHVEGFDNIS